MKNLELVKLSEEAFNSCEGRKEILRQLDLLEKFATITFKDGRLTYWQNDLATLVFKLETFSGKEFPLMFGLYLADTIKTIEADEFDWKVSEDGKSALIRLWWD